jgi:prepilin-type N-terminal cleavage/methylation domain-containing protein
MKRKAGLTMIELMVVIGIVLILIAITFPLINSSKASAHRTVCTSNLKQLHVGLSLYRSDWDGQERYGSISEMGLPIPRPVVGQYASDLLNAASLKCHEHGKPWEQHLPEQYAYFPMPEPISPKPGFTYQSWSKYTSRYQDDSIVFGDLAHNPTDHPYLNPDFPLNVFGVNLGGQLVKRRKPGDPYALEWWNK